MTPAENKDCSRDMVIRVSPGRNSLVVEEQKPGGIIAYKKISPVDLYFAINGSYLNDETLSSGFLPENCLQVSMDRKEKFFTIWNPELRADVVYQNIEYLNFPIPRLVFGIRMLDSGKVAECSLGVVADEKPTPETPMFYYPFSNVHPNNMVCTGNNVLPRYKKQAQLRNFPRFLLGLPDNDDMYDSEKNRLHLSHGKLMEHLKDKEPAYYYQKEDHTFNSAFYDLLNGLEKRLDYAKEHTSLPEAPDLARIEAFQMEVNERVVRDEI